MAGHMWGADVAGLRTLDDVVGAETLAQTDEALAAALGAFRSEAGATDGI